MSPAPVHLSFRPEVEVFDAAIRVGHPPDSLSPCGTASAVLAELDDRGIAKALVYHAHAELRSPRDGQALLDAFVEGTDRLLPQACVLPTDDSLALLKELESRRTLTSARLAWEPPGRLPFTPDFYGPLFSWLQERRIAVFIPAQSIDLEKLPDMARAFPRLPMVLTGAHYVDYLFIKPLLRAAPLLHLELSRYEAFGQVNELAAEFGPSRLIYASGYPVYAIGPVLFYLHRCRLPRPDLELICGGNLRRLLARGGAA